MQSLIVRFHFCIHIWFNYQGGVDVKGTWSSFVRKTRRRIGDVLRRHLSVAYDIRNTPQLQPRAGVDIFAVFHFHVGGLVQLGAAGSTNTNTLYPAIYYISAFHAQIVYFAGPRYANGQPINPNVLTDWAVDGRDRLRRTRVLLLSIVPINGNDTRAMVRVCKATIHPQSCSTT